jgi:hypothetical protein
MPCGSLSLLGLEVLKQSQAPQVNCGRVQQGDKRRKIRAFTRLVAFDGQQLGG